MGESGSGKTTIGRAIAGLDPQSQAEPDVLGAEMLGMRERLFKPLRRHRLRVPRPGDSFNPHLTIEQYVAEPLVVHEQG